jgi:hypothetical protein
MEAFSRNGFAALVSGCEPWVIELGEAGARWFALFFGVRSDYATNQELAVRLGRISATCRLLLKVHRRPAELPMQYNDN